MPSDGQLTCIPDAPPRGWDAIDDDITPDSRPCTPQTTLQPLAPPPVHWIIHREERTARPLTFNEGSVAPINVDNDVSCDEGMFNNGHGCEICPAGTSRAAVDSSCVDCPIGRFAGGAKARKECEPCPAGSASLTTSFVKRNPNGIEALKAAETTEQCGKCAEGFYGEVDPITSLPVCLPCPMGTFSSTMGVVAESACKQCPAGQVSGLAAMACQIATCIPGTFRSINIGPSQLPVCEVCPEGSMSNTEEASHCQLCGVHTFSPHRGSIMCSPCPVGEWSRQNATECIPCSKATTFDGDTVPGIVEQCRVTSERKVASSSGFVDVLAYAGVTLIGFALIFIVKQYASAYGQRSQRMRMQAQRQRQNQNFSGLSPGLLAKAQGPQFVPYTRQSTGHSTTFHSRVNSAGSFYQ